METGSCNDFSLEPLELDSWNVGAVGNDGHQEGTLKCSFSCGWSVLQFVEGNNVRKIGRGESEEDRWKS